MTTIDKIKKNDPQRRKAKSVRQLKKVAKAESYEERVSKLNHDFNELALLYATLKGQNSELLEALKELVKGHEVGMGRKAMQLRFDLAKDAIAKAEKK